MDFEDYYQKASDYVRYEQEPVFREEVIQAMNEEQIESLHDRFYTELAFGTAGMRGIIGGGYNRMNSYMVRRVTQGLSDYVNEVFPDKPSVVIAYDSRHYSQVFASAAASVLCANGIRVYLYDEIHPVPLLSFAVRRLQASAGITITASHNPSEYNGYKVYWSDGAQVIAPHDTAIVEKVRSITSGDMIAERSLADAVAAGMLTAVPGEVDEAYYAMVLNSISNPAIFSADIPCSVVYTPLHGSGNVPVQHLLKTLGVDYSVVAAQEEPDGDFPTVTMPNPENPDAMQLAIAQAKRQKADLILGTDPDSDRLGIGVPNDSSKQDYTLLGGNQIAVLLCDYLLSQQRQPITGGVCVKSIVTTDLMKRVAGSYGCECRDVLTGFKYIADQMHRITEEGGRFLFGAEESFGYLWVQEVYDKDAVSAAVLAVEMMLYHASQGTSLLERLDELMRQFGCFAEKVISKSYPGAEGKAAMEQIMKSFRTDCPNEIGSLQVRRVLDLKEGAQGLPPADVIIITLDGGSKVVIRPSGTEPKIKYYIFSVSEEPDLEAAKRAGLARQQKIMDSLGL
jgi:phosphoglucomutase